MSAQLELNRLRKAMKKCKKVQQNRFSDARSIQQIGRGQEG
jgi:hypothetical protein